jgi:ketosteroid isomerase-like protein
MKADDALRDELVALEEMYWSAIRDKDAATATSLSADPCVVVGAQGVGEIGRPALAQMVEGDAFELKRFSIEDVHLHRLTAEIAALAYKVKEDLVVDGKKVSLEAFDSSIWQRRDGRWVCVVHTESLAGDPFGRH